MVFRQLSQQRRVSPLLFEEGRPPAVDVSASFHLTQCGPSRDEFAIGRAHPFPEES